MPRIKGDKRTREVKIRLTEKEWNELQQRKTKSLAGWLRDLGLGAVPIRQADPDLIRHIARIGSRGRLRKRKIKHAKPVAAAVAA